MELALDPARNLLVLRLRPGTPAGSPRPAVATIDIGEGGRLLAVEAAVGDLRLAGGPPPGVSDDPVAGTVAIELDRQATGAVRSAAIEVGLVVDAAGTLLAVEVPRRGAGYEITYPSGNR